MTSLTSDIHHTDCQSNGLTPSAGSLLPDFFAEKQAELFALLDGTNINKTTFLTTDYLNHFSAILMLLEMMPIAPEDFAVDVLSWQPQTYAEHLTQSGFRDNELAIECYHYAPVDVRKAFDKVIAQLEDATKLIVKAIELALHNNQLEEIARICEDGTPQMRELIEQAASIVNGNQELIDGICAENASTEQAPQEQNASPNTSSQADIDALFK